MNDIHQELTVPLGKIDDRYSRYRLIYPKADKAMAASIERYGQLSPVVVGPAQKKCYPLIDGFKRLRASRRLGLTDLTATVLQAGERALKAAMFHLNKKHHSMTAMEEAVIVRSLYREHDLTQEAIGTLLGYHKSWVNRRLALLDRLDADVLEQVRLGLIGPGMIRELAKLPRGNQAEVLDTIRKHTMTCRESAQLVALVLESPRWAIGNILYYPEPILSRREPDRPVCNAQLKRLMKQLSSINRQCEDLFQRIDKNPPGIDSPEGFSQVQELFGRIETTLKHIQKKVLISDADF
jgi:ParB/RepB/Spo0J family partition protein